MKNKQPKYEDFTTEDFLGDEFFVKWVKSATQDTIQFWEEWTKLYPHKVPALLEAKNLILSTHYKKRESLDKKEILDIYEQIVKGNSVQESSNHYNFKVLWKNGLKVAAAILILIFAGIGIFQLNQNGIEAFTGQTEEIWVSSVIPKGRKITLRLTDGTIVKLNAGSHLMYPKRFTGEYRKVILKGEGFFDVVRNPDKPFIIETGDIETRVLGTSFNIKSDSIHNKVQVAVVSGVVEVRDKLGNNIKLEPDEAVTYDPEIRIIKKLKIDDIALLTGWKDGKLYFNKTSFEDICMQLENWYGVDIKLDEDFKMPGPYSGEYTNQSLENVLEGISYTSGFQFNIKNKTVYISN